MTEPHRVVGSGSRAYPYYVGPGLLDAVGEVVERASRAALRVIVTSPEIDALFGKRITASLRDWTPTIVMDDSESSKSMETAEALIGDLLSSGAKRDTVLIAVGGGVVGDTVGFVASIYLRGVELVHVPTTLLAQVDSSIGGKVAVNHPRGKNLVGSFYPPKAVVADIDVLHSLPRHQLLSGIFEALKGGVIADPTLFELTESAAVPLLALDEKTILELIGRAVDVKAAIVSVDEREANRRRLLNYGHTVGHGIEAASGYGSLTHGEAIAWGMIGANALAVHRGVLSAADARRIDESILRYKPRPVPPVEARRIFDAIELDKKFTASRRVMVLPKSVGECVIADDVSDAELRLAIDAALAASR